MANPVKLIDILSRNTAAESIYCDTCQGAGEISVPDFETGSNSAECDDCLGSGYNQLGLILHGILQPPEEGFGPVALKEAITAYLRRTNVQPETAAILETQSAIAHAQQAISETQYAIAQAQEMIARREPLAGKAGARESRTERRIS